MRHATGASGAYWVRRMLSSAAVVGAMTMSAHAQWTVVSLHPAGATESWAYDVQGGQEVGWVGNHASLWSGSSESWVDLNPAGAFVSYSYGVQGGQQVGWAGGYAGQHAGLWTGSSESWVDLNPVGADQSCAIGVYAGQQVGYARVAGGRQHAGLWSGTAESWLDLNPAGAHYSQANATSGSQQVGWVEDVWGYNHASLWSGTADSWVDLQPAGGGGFSEAYGVWDGQQVGVVGNHASLWSGTDDSWVDLNPAGAWRSYAFDIYGGQQAGSAYFGDDRSHAGLWSGSAASWVDLHLFLPSDFASSEADGIWSDGSFVYVVGAGWHAGTGHREALMWVSPVPEPAGGIVLLLGLGALPMVRLSSRRQGG